MAGQNENNRMVHNRGTTSNGKNMQPRKAPPTLVSRCQSREFWLALPRTYARKHGSWEIDVDQAYLKEELKDYILDWISTCVKSRSDGANRELMLVTDEEISFIYRQVTSNDEKVKRFYGVRYGQKKLPDYYDHEAPFVTSPESDEFQQLWRSKLYGIALRGVRSFKLYTHITKDDWKYVNGKPVRLENLKLSFWPQGQGPNVKEGLKFFNDQSHKAEKRDLTRHLEDTTNLENDLWEGQKIALRFAMEVLKKVKKHADYTFTQQGFTTLAKNMISTDVNGQTVFNPPPIKGGPHKAIAMGFAKTTVEQMGRDFQRNKVARKRLPFFMSFVKGVTDVIYYQIPEEHRVIQEFYDLGYNLTKELSEKKQYQLVLFVAHYFRAHGTLQRSDTTKESFLANEVVAWDKFVRNFVKFIEDYALKK